MSTGMMQAGMLVLLAAIVLVAVIGVCFVLRAFTSLREQQEATQKTLAGRDLGPVLHGLVQQTREVNRLLANIDKRLEKLEALEKVQIANMSFRDDPVRPKR